MKILNIEDSLIIRQLYIEAFIDTNTEYYKRYISELHKYSDGMCYEGYLWDCLKTKIVVTENNLRSFLDDKNNIYIMWDIHSSDNIKISNYWKFPKLSVLYMEEWDNDILFLVPEDVYIFDDSLLWSATFTHEIDHKGRRFCIYTDLE